MSAPVQGDAFHLPALPHLSTTTWSYGRSEEPVRLRVAQPSAAALVEQVDALLEARAEHLAERPVAEVVRVIDLVAGRLLDPADPLRREAEAVVPLTSGLSAPMVRRLLDRTAADWRAPRLLGLLRAEFGEPEVLDGFRPRGRAWGRSHAYGPRLATHLFSGEAPGAAVGSLIRVLLVKGASLAKLSISNPLLPALFARGVAEADEGLGRCLAVAYWPAGDAELDRLALNAADLALVQGGPETVAAARARAPATTRVLGQASGASFAVVAREALETGAAAARLAETAALEVALFDQRGAASPHLYYVEAGGELSPEQWADMLAAALQQLERELPRGTLSPGETAAIRQARSEAAMRPLAGEGARVIAPGESTAWTVIHDPDPAFRLSGGNRLVRVKPVESLEAVVPLAAAAGVPLHTVGVAGPEERVAALARALGEAGAGRVAPIGGMVWAPPSAHLDGQPPLRSLVRWCDWG